MSENTNEYNFYDLEAEKFLLGSLINDNNLIQNVDYLHENHFYAKLNGQIFEAIVRIVNKGLVADVKTVLSETLLSKDMKDGLDEEGLSKYLKEDIESRFTITTVSSLANTIHIMYLRRNALSIGKLLIEDCNSRPPSELGSVIGDAVEMLDGIQDSAESNSNSIVEINKRLVTVLKHLNIARKSDRNISGISTGLRSFDSIIGGLKSSDLIILAARPSMGKTALAISMATNIARMNKRSGSKEHVLFFSLEMSGEQIATRAASILLRRNSKIFDTGRDLNGERISDQDFANISEELQEFADLPILIDSTPALTISAIRRKVRKISRVKKIGAIFVDYLQLVRGNVADSNNRVQEVSEVTQGLKRIAKEENVPVIALAQLSRAVESRESTNFKPQLSDLRESGSIEQDADIVSFLYREAYYLERKGPENPDKYTPENERNGETYIAKKEEYNNFMEKLQPVKNLAQLIVSKNRNGSVGVASCHFDSNILEFSDLSYEFGDE